MSIWLILVPCKPLNVNRPLTPQAYGYGCPTWLIAFVNPKCANDAKQKQRVRIACVFNGKQNSAVYGAAAHTSGGLHVARGDHIRQPQTVWGDHLFATDSPGGPLVLLWTVLGDHF